MDSSPQYLTLADLPQVLVAQVVGVVGDCVICERLRELGLCPGTEVRFERQAPFGGPMVVSLRGYQLALRPNEAKRVKIQSISSLGDIR
ncbi:MAG: FeoA family protein [Planctomycetota bacterium]